MLRSATTAADHHCIPAIIDGSAFYQEHGQGDPANRSNAIHDIATNCGQVLSSLDDKGIDVLCERLNFGDTQAVPPCPRCGSTKLKGSACRKCGYVR